MPMIPNKLRVVEPRLEARPLQKSKKKRVLKSIAALIVDGKTGILSCLGLEQKQGRELLGWVQLGAAHAAVAIVAFEKV